MINDLVAAFVLGLIGGMIPGPILTAIFTEILQGGFIGSFRIILIGMLTETLVAVICLVAFSSFNFSESVFRLISFIGAGILLGIASMIWKITKIDTKKRLHFGVLKIGAMILANGGLWIFWITVCIPKAIHLSHQIRFGGVIFLFCVEVGWLFSTLLLAFTFSRFRTWLSKPKIVSLMFKLFSLTFVYFSLSSIYQSITFFLRR